MAPPRIAGLVSRRNLVVAAGAIALVGAGAIGANCVRRGLGSGRGGAWYEAAPLLASVRSDGRAGVVVGIGLVLIGLWFLVREYLPEFNWNLVWPVVIVVIGLFMLFNASRRS